MFAGLTVPPPQEMDPTIIAARTHAPRTCATRLRCTLPTRVKPMAPKLNHQTVKARSSFLPLRFRAATEWAAMVRTEVTALLPGVTEAGLNEQVRALGR